MNTSQTVHTGLAITTSLTLDPTLYTLLGEAYLRVKAYLGNFATDPYFSDKIAIAFGEVKDVNTLQLDWQAGSFAVIPSIQILSRGQLNGANGAFAGSTNQIYLSAEFLQAHPDDPEAVAGVLLEEIGHRIDQLLNAEDSRGDEGAIFSALARGQTLSQEQLQQLSAEDDTGVITINGESVAVEMQDQIFTVTNSNDSGEGSLRWAITQANSIAGLDRIFFNIGSGGVQTITPLSALPRLTQAVIIDGTTQPGFSGVPLIAIDGSLAGQTPGITVTGGSTIKGLIIKNFADIAIAAEGDAANPTTTIQGNQIFGNGKTGHTGGLLIGSNVLLGGPNPQDRNYIFANNAAGIFLRGSNITVEGNSIGVDPAGIAQGNLGFGIESSYESPNNHILNNIIASNSSIGIAVSNRGGHLIENNVIENNKDAGVVLAVSGNTVRTNIVRGNTGSGINVLFSSVNNLISSNQIYGNGRLGIDLNGNGVTLNDVGDADTGSNQLQNFPILSKATRDSNGLVTITGSLNSKPNEAYRIELFANITADPSGYGEGQEYLGFTTVTTDSTGKTDLSFTSASSVPLGGFITAVASDSAGNTSEFSDSKTVVTVRESAILSISSTTYSAIEGGNAKISILRTGNIQGQANATLFLTDGTATYPSDYGQSSFTVSFNDGEASKLVEIPIVGDTVTETIETIFLTLANPSSDAKIGTTSTASLNIRDAEPLLSFIAPSFRMREGGLARVTVIRGGSLEEKAGATIFLTDGSATAPEDYANEPITFELAPGESTRLVPIPVLNDLLNEGNETVHLSLGSPTGGVTIGSQKEAILNIGAGNTIFVNANAAGNNDGTSWINAFKDLQKALTEAQFGDEVWVAKGTYKPTQGNDRTAAFRLKDGVMLYGGFAGREYSLNEREWQTNSTTLSGNIGSASSQTDNSSSVVIDPEATSRATRLDGFTIIGGYSSSRDAGGGISSRGNATFANLIVQENQSQRGGGISSLKGNPLVMDVTFTNNTATESGGGMAVIDGSAELINVRFIGNKAGSSLAGGGGLHTDNRVLPGTITVTNSLFYKNEAVRGGGVWSYASSPVITNATFVENKSNSSFGSGYSNRFYGKPIISNSIFWNNQGGTSIIDETGNDTTVLSSIVQGGYAGIGNLNADPLFVDAPNGNFKLQEDSPAVNFGTNLLLPLDWQDLDGDGNKNELVAEDLIGSNRIVHDTVDAGAYEYSQPFSTIHKIAFSASSFNVDENQSVAEVYLTRYGVGEGEVTATLTVTNGTAVEPLDYIINSSTIPVTFAAGQKTVRVAIPILEDTIVETDETIQLSLSNVGGASLGARSTAILTILDNDAPDLVVSSIRAPTQAIAGEQAEIIWTVTNQGTVEATGTWTDRIYLSADRTAGSDLFLGESSFTGTIAPGQTIERKQLVALPIDLSDDRYVVVTTDVNNQLNEKLPNEKNNTTVDDQAIRLFSADVPDLVVSSITAPSHALSGEEVEVTWTVKNQGAFAATGSWSDRVYLSSDQQGGNGQFIGDFAFTGAIAAGEVVERKQKLTVPIDLNGDRYFVVTANFGKQLFESVGNERNNTTVDDRSIQVTLAPFPNLQVTSVTAPPTAFSSQETVVQWAVKNTGNGATSAPFWYDGVWLSLDQKLDGSDRFLGQVANPNFLREGESYTNNLTVKLPQGIQDNYYFLVATDSSNQVYEYQQENDNLGFGSSTQVQLTPPPDLRVSTVQAPTNAFSGQTINLSWTVSNSGSGRTLETEWYDQVFLSADETLDKGDRTLGEFIHNGILNSNANYTANQSINLPTGISGDFFVFVKTDTRNQVYESLFESNNDNHDIPATKISLTPPPDLEIETLSIPSAARAGTAFTLNYQVTNLGATATPTTAWTDSFYLSADDQLNLSTDIKLGDRTHLGALQPDASYSESTSFTLSNTLAGSYYVFAVTDANDDVFELDNNNNQARSLGKVEIVARPADLTVAATAPLRGESGKAVRVQWTVTNQGSGDTIVTSWSDQVIASTNKTFGDSDDVVLTSFTHTGSLNPGQSYVQNELVTIPFDLVGLYQFFVATDVDYAVYEADLEDNNASLGVPVTVTRSTPDLQVTQITAPGTAVSGQGLNLSWTVQNPGTGTTNANYWYDGIYLSQDTVVTSDDAFLGNVYHSGALGAGSSYTATKTLTLPNSLAGQFHVLVQSDSTNQVIEGSLEGNNVRATTDKVQISLGAVPDLVIQSVDAPDKAISGQSLALTWTGVNYGAQTSSDWQDAFYLSRDKNFDRNSDTYIGRAIRDGGLEAGQSYTASGSFELPRGLAGGYYVFAVTDAGEKVDERSGESNNATFDPTPIQVILPPPADLVVTAIIPPSAGIAGQPITITYTVTNQGTEAALGIWDDSVYLSTDAQWDIKDVLVGKVVHSGDVASGASYTGNVNTNLPGLTLGSYYAIVRSDIRNQVAETNEANNTEVSSTKATIDVPQLQLGTSLSGLLGQDGAVFYRVDVAAGESLLIEFDSVSNSAFNELYVSYGGMPTRAGFDFGYTQPLAADQKILVPTTQAGTYYIAAFGNSVPAIESYTIKADTIDFAVLDENYGKGGTAGNRTIQINGNKFDRTVTASLTDDMGLELAAKQYYWVDSNRFYATFDLTQAAPGTYDVVVTNTSGKIDVVIGGLEVVAGGGSQLKVDLDVPEAVRRPLADRFGPGRFNASVTWHNDGINDAFSPLIDISSTAPLSLDPTNIPANGISQEPFRGYPVTYLFGTGIDYYATASGDGPAGVVLPNQAGQILLYGLVDPKPTDIVTNLNIAQLSDPYPWEEHREALRYIDLTEEEFQPIFEQLIKQVGTTWASYLEMLGRNANLMPPELGDIHNQRALLALELDKARAAVDTSISGIVSTEGLDLAIAGRVIVAESMNNRDLFTTFVLNDGSFVFADLPAGQYRFKASGLLVKDDSLLVVDLTEGQAISNLVIPVIAGVILKATIESSSGQLLKDALVSVYSGDESIAGGITDSEGKTLIPALRPGKYNLLVDAPGSARTIIENVEVTDQGGEILVKLVSESVITGTVLLMDKLITDNITIVATRQEDDSFISSKFYDLSETGSFEFLSLPEGKYDLNFFSEGYLLQALSGLTVSAGSKTDVGLIELEQKPASLLVSTSNELTANDAFRHFRHILIEPALLATELEYSIKLVLIPFLFDLEFYRVVKDFLENEPPYRPLRMFRDKSQTVEKYFRNTKNSEFLFNRVFQAATKEVEKRFKENPDLLENPCDINNPQVKTKNSREFKFSELFTADEIQKGNLTYVDPKIKYGSSEWSYDPSIAGGVGYGGDELELFPDSREITGKIKATRVSETQVNVEAVGFQMHVIDTFDFWPDGNTGKFLPPFSYKALMNNYIVGALKDLEWLEMNEHANDIALDISCGIYQRCCRARMLWLSMCYQLIPILALLVLELREMFASSPVGGVRLERPPPGSRLLPPPIHGDRQRTATGACVSVQAAW